MPNSWSKGKPLPNKAQLKELQEDARCVQWKSIAKTHFMLSGELLGYGKIHKLMKPRIDAGLMEDTEYRGWYRLTTKGWEVFEEPRKKRGGVKVERVGR